MTFFTCKKKKNHANYRKVRRKHINIIWLTMTLLFISIFINNSTPVLKKTYPLKFNEYVFKYSRDNLIDPYLVFAIIKAESSFNPDALSQKNAYGLMQLTKKTAEWGAESKKLEEFSVEELYIPETNIMLGCWYLGQLMMEFNGNTNLVLAAYNGGSGNVKEWLGNKNLSKTGYSLDRIPFVETKRFVEKVANYYHVYLKLYEVCDNATFDN